MKCRDRLEVTSILTVEETEEVERFPDESKSVDIRSHEAFPVLVWPIRMTRLRDEIGSSEIEMFEGMKRRDDLVETRCRSGIHSSLSARLRHIQQSERRVERETGEYGRYLRYRSSQMLSIAL